MDCDRPTVAQFERKSLQINGKQMWFNVYVTQKH